MYSEEQIYTLCKVYEISKLDVNRIYRYIDKFYKQETPTSNNNNNLELPFDQLIPM